MGNLGVVYNSGTHTFVLMQYISFANSLNLVDLIIRLYSTRGHKQLKKITMKRIV